MIKKTVGTVNALKGNYCNKILPTMRDKNKVFGVISFSSPTKLKLSKKLNSDFSRDKNGDLIWNG